MKKGFIREVIIALVMFFCAIVLVGLITLDAVETSTVIDENYEYTVLGNGTIEITKYTGTATEVVIPKTIDGKTVTSIGERAFYGSALTNIEISEEVITIGEYAFSSSNLTSIEIPKGVTKIENNTFANCGNLISIKFPEGIISIGDYAFVCCQRLKNLEIPRELINIGTSAFAYCSSLTSIELPETVTSIGRWAFEKCENLANIEVNINNKEYSSENGILFNKEKTEIICYPAGKKDVEYHIPASVTSVGVSAFAYCSNLTNIEFTEKITSIGSSGFRGCKALASVNIPKGLTTIGFGAFSECSGLKSITIPNNVTSIGDSTFSYCTNLTIYCRSESIAEIYAESNGITCVIDDEPPILENITGNPSDWTEGDVTLTINGAKDSLSGLAEKPYSFDGGATWQAENTKIYEEKTRGIIIKVRDNLANEYTHQTINITKIDKDAPEIESVTGNPSEWTEDDVTLTINGAEDVLSGLAERPYSFDGGETWQVENTKTYENNTDGVVIKVRDTLENEYTHEEIDITKIRKVEYIEVTTRPAKTEYMVNENFESAGMKIKVTYDNGEQEETTNYSILNGTSLKCGKQRIIIKYNTNPTIAITTEVLVNVNHDMQEATCTEPAKCKECDYIEGEPLGHKEVTDQAIEATCTQTGLTEGKHCSVCGEVLVVQEVIPASHTEVIDQAVAATCISTGLTEGKHCSVCGDVLIKQTVVDALGHTEVIDQAVAPTCTETGLTEGKHCSVCNEVLVAQTEVKALGHTEVIDEAVAPTDYETGLTQGSHCLVCNKVLVEQQAIPALNTVVQTWNISATEQDNVIAKLYNNGTLLITGSGNMKNYGTINSEYSPWYDNRNNIKNVQIGNGVNNVGNAAFFDCRQIININIPEGLINIGEYAFRCCKSLTKIVLPESVSNIGGSAFSDCISLSDIKIPDKVNSISRGLFYNCDALENINIPEGVSVIGRNAFGDCGNLTTIRIPASVATIEEYPFNLCDKLTSINVDEQNSSYMSEGGILFNKDKTKLICYPASKSDIKEYIVPYTVKTIEAYSFTCCSNLENIIIQDETTHIGGIAFYNCRNLKNITISKSITNIGLNILLDCINLKNINVYCNSYAEGYIKENYNDKINILHTEIIDKAVAPTCTKQGYTTHTCTRCGDEKVDTYVDATGHNFGEWTIIKEATCTETGIKKRECINCFIYEEHVNIPALGHNYENGECTRCGEESPAVTVNTQIYNIVNRMIARISPKTALSAIKSKIQTNASKIETYNKNNRLVEDSNSAATGMKMRFYLNGKYDEYTLVVTGDTDGNGESNFDDILQINKHRLNKVSLVDESLKAGDVDGNGKAEFNDILKINKYRLGKINSL